MTEAELQPGQVIGNDFEIVRRLGSGGMGAVYLARQSSTDKQRAVKVMRSRYSDEASFVRRFEQEAKVGARVHSHHVVEVVAAGVDSNLRLPWLAMEYLEGKTLGSALEQLGVPPQADAEVILQQLFHAVAAAHDAHIVHRDLKPENIFLARSQSPAMPFLIKVLDFGIAKWLQRDAALPTEALWTTLWGAPEQSRRGHDIGPQTDVWALGLLLFWMFTGHSYWHAERGLQGVLHEILYEPLLPASQRAVELHCTRPLSPQFEQWFQRCVAREPAQRFTHAREAYSALQHVSLDWPLPQRSWRVDTWPEYAHTATGAANAPWSEPALTVTQSGSGRVVYAPPCVTAGAAGATGNDKSRTLLRRSLGLGAVALVTAAATAWVGSGLLGQPTPGAIEGSLPATNPAREATAAPPEGMRRIVVSAQNLAPAQAPPEDYFMDETEVVVSAYAQCVQAQACTPSGLTQEQGRSADNTFERLCNARFAERALHPINCVNLFQARQYCAFVGKRLPTALEWSFAASAGERRRYPWGNSPPASCEMAVVSGLCARNPPTRPAQQRSATASSAFGVLDLTGNVWEWVEPHAASPQPLTQASLLGGGWDSTADNATNTSLLTLPPQHADVNTGFRCVRTATRVAAAR